MVPDSYFSPHPFISVDKYQSQNVGYGLTLHNSDRNAYLAVWDEMRKLRRYYLPVTC
jgi:hypothetical protein